ncbi:MULTISPECIES: CYTH domain-containing protein [Aneurinibacillus]|uniref:CYTH domain-containing protein n=1 Tax=Aneurinibacillus thermoaerophilus TaxID=143495 RepID=A0A1G8F6Q3_ANETH|nr:MULTISPECIES: CYTH domain-containing protein [Aneurinibacillus]AMA71536.1 hypothetical protein ACH33_00935 [Aneurinibacillus sp. XH2]MED0675179.1 CYTH domain-containing protein [Aneurinibacillus thermoaerophilus]MED0677743.1 CYTH domain-containing protein [Aneurinibacillus thermoaerophilus]MED0735736.1 CYTH domain-containing protein [Aneurinibacillus thermoaerophilus]MED0758554.1 CYTH domain-containing protein [Aneurinibacillus thermoaerophilus]
MPKREQELKLMVTKETYEKLLAYADPEKPLLQQTNYYFDTPDFYMGKNGVMLRVREENGTWILCAKIKQKSQSSAISAIELETEISPDMFVKGRGKPEILVNLLPPEGQEAIYRLITPSELVLRGTLHNERRILHIIDDYTFELDRTFFPNGQEEYELEIEGMKDEAACQRVMQMLTKMGYSYSVNQKSKYQRLQEAIVQELK